MVYKTLKQHLQQLRLKYTSEPYATPNCGSPLYQERDVLEAVTAWLTQEQEIIPSDLALSEINIWVYTHLKLKDKVFL